MNERRSRHGGSSTNRSGFRLSYVCATLLSVLVLVSACTTATPPESNVVVPSLPDVKREVRAYVDSGRYERDIAAITEQASAYIKTRADRGGKLAIVVDIDETALSNLPFLRANDFSFLLGTSCDLERGPCGFGGWAQLARAEALKPVLALTRFAKERGVAVFFITGRPERMRASTETNLRAAGYEWTRVILKPNDMTTKSAVEFKAPERKKIVDIGHTIVVNIGDQMSDLDGGFAERAYKLPNPFYFIP